MNNKLVHTIQETFKNRSIEELVNIYIENDRYNYSDEAFEAIRMILQEKNISLPLQNEQLYKAPCKTFSKDQDKHSVKIIIY